MTQIEPRTARKSGRRFRTRGAEPLELTLVLLPLLAMVTVLLDTSWAVFAKAALQRAVRIGVRTGITLTSSQMAQGACLTDTVKGIVQSNAMGLLGSGTASSGYALMKVHYFQPPATGSTSAATDVSANSDGDQPGNIMQVSVQNYSLNPLVPRIFNWKTKADTNPLVIQGAYSADLIEPASATVRPCIGTAP
jgi:Flp pilus assembly protein TadG